MNEIIINLKINSETNTNTLDQFQNDLISLKNILSQFITDTETTRQFHLNKIGEIQRILNDFECRLGDCYERN